MAAYLTDLQSAGRYTFSTAEAQEALGGSLQAAQAALRRQKVKGHIADPLRGFHVIVPPEYRRLGCLPAEQFVPDLMRHLEEPYYAALLTAAAYHGAAHQRPQVFQVMVAERRRDIECGEVRVQFVVRGDLDETSCIERSTLRGVLHVASPAATALEIVGYPEHSGGLDNVATVLTELIEEVTPAALEVEARRTPMSWVQRLGYLLGVIEANECIAVLERVLAERGPARVPLVPGLSREDSPIDTRWKLVINTDVEADL